MKQKPVHQLLRVARHRRSLPVRLLARGAEGFLRLYNNVNYDAEGNGERRVLERLGTRKVQCVFDVGASIGEWSLLAQHCCPSATIHAFEIVPATFTELQRRVGARERTNLNPFGLADHTAEVEVLYCADDPELSSVFRYATGRHPQPIRCHVTTGDEYCEGHGITHIDFVKLDVEGGELPALRGFEQMLSSGRIDVIQFEYGLINLVPKFLLKDLYEFLGAHAYVVGKIFPTYVDFRQYEYKDEDFTGPNYLAVRADQRELITLLS